MLTKKHKVSFKRFLYENYIGKDTVISIAFIILFLFCGFFEKNLVLPEEGLGLLEHRSIWIFLITNSMMPCVMRYFTRRLDKLDHSSQLDKLTAGMSNKLSVLFVLSSIIGFCFWVGNTLQNANVINELSFDYWDSINYRISYILSRIYKLYLFADFIPTVFVYLIALIKSISDSLEIKSDNSFQYPITYHADLNILCGYGLKILLTVMLPFVLCGCSVYTVHEQFDITSVSTFAVLGTGSLLCMYLYWVLVRKFHNSIVEYKKNSIKVINIKLSEIHNYILTLPLDEEHSKKFDYYIKRISYLKETKEDIEKIKSYPHIIQALFTSISPLIPVLLKNIALTFKDFL